LKGKQDRRQNGHDKSPKKSKIRRKITTRKRIKSTIKIKSRTSYPRPKNAGLIMNDWKSPGVPGTPYLTAWANSGKSGRASREQALHRMAIRQARLERLALSASGHERMVKGPTAASKEQRIDFFAGIAWFGGILNYRVVVRRDWTPFGL